MQTYKETKKLLYYKVTVPKQDSSFLYFILESNENICFYSTLIHKEGDINRVVEIYSPIENESFMNNLLEHLAQTISELHLEKNTIVDD